MLGCKGKNAIKIIANKIATHVFGKKKRDLDLSHVQRPLSINPVLYLGAPKGQQRRGVKMKL